MRSGFGSLLDDLSIEQGEPIGQLKVARNDYMGHRFVSDAIEHFRNRYPSIRFVMTLTEAPIRGLLAKPSQSRRDDG
jgi:DNA-binding transcriptional LysR family regulator